MSAILDETLGSLVHSSGKRAVTARLTVNFRKMVPLNSVVRVRSKIDRIEGKKIFASCVGTNPANEVVCEADALFIEVNWLKLFK